MPFLEGKRILLVEDEGFIALDMMMILRDVGAVVVGPVTTLAQALDVAHGIAVDAALLDVSLARQLVWPAADVLMQRGVPIIFVTGYAGMEFPRPYAPCLKLEKPVDKKALFAALAQAMGVADSYRAPHHVA
jgi:CheY-like chemotaxis protein